MKIEWCFEFYSKSGFETSFKKNYLWNEIKNKSIFLKIDSALTSISGCFNKSLTTFKWLLSIARYKADLLKLINLKFH